MTATFDPHDPAYLDEADVRGELTRGFGICVGCRRCTDVCPTFPTLFELVDGFDDRDPGRLTPAEQDRIVDSCFQCERCALDCPYTPARSDAALDLAGLVRRAEAMRLAAGQMTIRHRIATRALGGSPTPRRTPIVRLAAAAPPRSFARRALEVATGVSSVRLLPPSPRRRFSTWFRRRDRTLTGEPQSHVTVFPTCLVEHHAPAIGHDLVRVYERNGVDCSLSEAGCCGAPLLHAGDVGRFAKAARQNVAILAREARRGGPIVVPQPTCALVVAREYPIHVDAGLRADAELVADHVRDASEYLLALHRGEGTRLDTRFPGEVPSRVVYHVACHVRARGAGNPGRELVELTGAKVTILEACSGIGGGWGFRSGHEAASVAIAAALGELLASAASDSPTAVVVGDCSIANTAIVEQTRFEPLHPLQLVARAYGIPEA